MKLYLLEIRIKEKAYSLRLQKRILKKNDLKEQGV